MARKKTPASEVAEQVVSSSKSETRMKKHYTSDDFVPTGSTMFNVCMSDLHDGGYALGTMANLIGDSSSGKTFLALTCLAEAARDQRFKDYRLIYDDVEAACAFDIEYLFGKRLARRIENLGQDEENPASDTVQEFGDNVARAIEDGQPFIYILDSLDALTSEEEIDVAENQRKQREAGKEVKGTYGMTKAKGMSQLFRLMVRSLKKTRSLVIIISQTRDNVDPMSFKKVTRSGGRALKFYATHEIWVAVGQQQKKKERVIGVDALIKVEKNKITGKKRDCKQSIFYDYGIDDIGACVDFLVKEGVFKGGKNGAKIDAGDLLDIEPAQRAKFIELIEQNDLEDELSALVGEKWLDIEESLRLKRKPKFK